MFDCSKDVRAYHDQKVTLPQSERTAMRDRRDANRRRLCKGLENAGDPAPDEFVKQGSYAMRTMVQHPENDYDIDDGVYFLKAALVGARGAELTSLQARTMVRDAVDDGSFTDPPQVRSNCVRIFYQKGYHVDMPVYRTVEENGATHYELASSGGWKRSDARDVSAWFEDELCASTDGPQARRLVRYLKIFARSRTSWSGRVLSGFGITVLVMEQKRINTAREDRALYDTMRAMRDRLNWNLEIRHPVTTGDTITSGPEDSKAALLRDKLSEALRWLEPLFKADCTRNEALGCWDKVFNTTFFSERGEVESRSSASLLRPAVAASAALMALEGATSAAVLSGGAGRHA